ncbi:MAG: flagellin [Phycisphaerae bacterium]|nr:flagellin [Phycisphaerae bacterium]
MGRINTNIPSLVARANLNRSSNELEMRLNRLSTGLRIVRGADDPAGLIISERLRSDIKGTDQGVKNSERASSVIATAEGALAEVSDLLNSIRALIVEAANTGANSAEERAANQLQIDSAIDSITRISNTASFGGLKLLNGSLDYNLSGLATSAISKAQVFGASFIGTTRLQVDVDVLGSAQTGALYLRGDYSYAPAGNGTFLSSMTLRVAGPRGVTEVVVQSGASLASLVTAINRVASLTGVRAEQLNGADITSGLVFRSEGYGSNAFVSVERIGGPSNPANSSFHTFQLANNGQVPSYPPFAWATMITAGLLTEANRDAGRDVSALVNGTLATGDGLTVSINSPALSLKMLLNTDFATDPTATPTSFTITGGGALFQLGPVVTAQQQTNVGVQSVAASNLGGTLINGALEFLSSLKSGQANSIQESFKRNDYTAASSILESAIDEVSIVRGRLGAFERNVLQTNVRSLQAAFENLSASESKIRDSDFAAETSALTRAQILQSAGTSVLALANQASQTVLQLLG